MVAPAPGSTPIKKPWMDWRPMTGAMDFASARLMRRSLISPCLPSASPDRLGSNTRKIASGRANIAMARVMKPKPDCKSITPIVKRGMLKSAPSPTVAMISPRIVIISALAIWPEPANAAMAESPTTIRAKYSAE